MRYTYLDIYQEVVLLGHMVALVSIFQVFRKTIPCAQSSTPAQPLKN